MLDLPRDRLAGYFSYVLPLGTRVTDIIACGYGITQVIVEGPDVPLGDLVPVFECERMPPGTPWRDMVRFKHWGIQAPQGIKIISGGGS